MQEEKTEIQNRIESLVTNGLGFCDSDTLGNKYFREMRDKCNQFKKFLAPYEIKVLETALLRFKLSINESRVAKDMEAEAALDCARACHSFFVTYLPERTSNGLYKTDK